MEYNKIGFIIADDGEFAPVQRHCRAVQGTEFMRRGKKYCKFKTESGIAVIAVLCNVGKVNAAEAAAAMILEDRPDCIINFGLSGAVSGVYKNEIVIAKSFVEHDFDLTPLGYKLGVKPGQEYIYYPDKQLSQRIMSVDEAIIPCIFVTGDRFISDDAARKIIIDEFGGNCCDMESAAIASVCSDFDVPFASLRYLSDSADDEAVTSYRKINNLQKDTLLKIVLKAFSD